MSEQQCEVSQLVAWYREFLDHGKSAAFVSCVATRYDNGTLCRMTDSADPESRRAAVLALGMLGSATSIPAIGRCLADSDRCVRLVAEMSFSDVCRRAYGDNCRRQLDVARRHLDGKRYDEAEERLVAITSAWPEAAEAWYLSALVRFCKQDFIPAIGLARRAVKFNEFHFSAHALEGRVWLELEAPTRALTSFQKSLSINPSQIAIQNYVDVLTRQIRSGN